MLTFQHSLRPSVEMWSSFITGNVDFSKRMLSIIVKPRNNSIYFLPLLIEEWLTFAFKTLHHQRIWSFVFLLHFCWADILLAQTSSKLKCRSLLESGILGNRYRFPDCLNFSFLLHYMHEVSSVSPPKSCNLHKNFNG